MKAVTIAAVADRGAADTPWTRRERRALVGDPADAAARAIVAVLFLLLAWRLGVDFAATGRPTSLLLLAGEACVVVFTLIRRHASAVNRRFVVRLTTAVSLASPLFLRPAAGSGIAPETVTALIAAAGLCIAVAGKMSLGRSFGLLPAHRGLVRGGGYRWVRHPIYLGYLLTHVAFVLAHPTAANILAVAVADLTLVLRAAMEERMLGGDAAYAQYARQVRWRLIPFVY